MEQTIGELMRQLQVRNSNGQVSGMRKLKMLMTKHMKKSMIATILKDKRCVERECWLSSSVKESSKNYVLHFNLHRY